MSEDNVVDMRTREPLVRVRTRAEMVADGTLVDVSRMAAAIGYLVPVAFTRAAYAAAHHGHPDPAHRAERAHHVLQMALFVAAGARGAQSAPFECYPGGLRLALVAHIGPGDTIDPVLTFALPEES